MNRIFPDPIRVDRNFPDLSGKFRKEHSGDRAHWCHTAPRPCRRAHTLRPPLLSVVKDANDAPPAPHAHLPRSPALSLFSSPSSCSLCRRARARAAAASPSSPSTPGRTDRAGRTAASPLPPPPKHACWEAPFRANRARLPEVGPPLAALVPDKIRRRPSLSGLTDHAYVLRVSSALP